MITLEQAQLLEAKVSHAIETIQRLVKENALLRDRLEGYQKRINELEGLVHQFKEDQGHIENAIISALDRLNQFEDILEPIITQQPAEEASEQASPNIFTTDVTTKTSVLEEDEIITPIQEKETDSDAGKIENKGDELDIF